MHLLLIEDQEKIAQNIQECLEAETYAVTRCGDGLRGFEKAMLGEYDLIILDLNLPGMDGIAICRGLRERGRQTPILMLTARTKREEIITGLDVGADDYLTKPFDLEELLARVRALLRRKVPERGPKLQAKNILVDTNTREAWKGPARIPLSPKEYALLEFLLRHKGVVQDRPRIIEHVWGGRDDLLFSQTVDVHVAYLRRKLGKDIIRTIPGKGYLIPESAQHV